MATNNKTIPIPGRLHSVASDGIVTGADEIFDDTKQKTQSVINQDVDQVLSDFDESIGSLEEAVGSGGSIDSRIATAKAEVIGGATSNGNTLKKLEDRLSPVETAVGTGGSVDSRIAAAKAEIIGNATSACDTLGKAEALISAEATARQSAINSVIGDAASDYNTLGKLEDKIQTEATARGNADIAIDGRLDTLEEAVGSGGSVDERIADAVSTETTRATAAEGALDTTKADKATTLAGYGITDAYTKSETYTKTEVNGLVDTPHQEYVTVDAYANLPATGSKDTIYRVSNYNGSQVDASVYSEYAWNGSQYIFLCVKSQIGEVFDISVYNNNAKYVDLAAALDGGNNIPQSLQKGGISVKFVQSSDNKYVQYRFTRSTFTAAQFINLVNWQKQGAEVVVTQNIQTTLQEGTKVDVDNKLYPIGDYSRQSRLDSDLCSIVSIEHNTINSGNGTNVEGSPLRARTAHYIAAPFNMVLNTGFLFNNILKYSRDINGRYIFVETITPSQGSLSINDNYMYRITFRKEDNTEITDADLLNIVSSFDGALKINTANQTNNINAIKKKETFYNVNSILETYSTYYTLQTAINAIPLADRRPLMTIAYRIGINSYVFAQYLKSALNNDNFLDTNSWKVIINTDESYVTQQHSGFTNVNVYNGTTTGYSTIIDAVSTIAEVDRRMGHIITFRDEVDVNIWHVYQYKVSSTTDNYWLNANNWTLKDIKEVDFRFTEIGGIDKNTGNVYGSGSYKCTPYLIAKVGMTIRGYESSTNAMIAFYDSQFNYISSYPTTAGTAHTVTLTAQDIPSGAVYLRASGTDGFIKDYEGTTIDTLAVDLWKNQELQDFVSFLTRGVMYPLGNASIGDVISLATNAQTECIAIPCNEGDRFIITGKGGVNPRLWGWCDTDMKLLSCSEESITENKLLLIAPTNAKYFIFNNIFMDKTAEIVKDNRNYEAPTVATSKWLALGDSITQGYYSRIPPTPDAHPYALDPKKGWAYLTSQITGKTLINKAIGGTGVSYNHGTAGNSGRELIDTLISNGTLDSSIDLITIAYGVNDWKYNCTLGTWEDAVTPTNDHIIPSMRYVIERCCAAAPNAKIIVIMPINCKFGTEANNWGIGYPFSNNGTLELIYEKFKQICEYYGIEYIDMLHSSIVNRKNIGDVLLDNVHPSIPTHVAMARELSQKINCY